MRDDLLCTRTPVGVILNAIPNDLSHTGQVAGSLWGMWVCECQREDPNLHARAGTSRQSTASPHSSVFIRKFSIHVAVVTHTRMDSSCRTGHHEQDANTQTGHGQIIYLPFEDTSRASHERPTQSRPHARRWSGAARCRCGLGMGVIHGDVGVVLGLRVASSTGPCVRVCRGIGMVRSQAARRASGEVGSAGVDCVDHRGVGAKGPFKLASTAPAGGLCRIEDSNLHALEGTSS